MSALKPCPNPFCAHSSPKIWQGAVAKKWRGTCRQCHIETAAFDTEAEAITAWNTRASDELVPELVGALELALEYWAHRQQRYKNRSPVWVQDARAALAKHRGQG